MSQIIIGEVDWLRNDYMSDITIGEITYPNLEQAYQAAKHKDREIKLAIANAESVREARKIARGTPQSEDFDRTITMKFLLRKKFHQAEDLGVKLAKTGNTYFVMKGYDGFWGTGDDGDGQNMLGQLLEEVRAELQFELGIDPDVEEDSDVNPPIELGIDPDVEEDSDVNPPTLKDAILNAPDEELAEACQEMYECAQVTVSLLDQDDYNAEHIASKTGAPIERVRDAITKVKKFAGALTRIEELLTTPSEEDCDCEEDDEEDEDQID